jgi:sulfopyruvate decarboxylase TPP-binding subunit
VTKLIDGPTIAATLAELDVTHVVWLPDSLLGTWESAIESHPALQLVRVCREGEAWVIAAGLYLGGKRPIVVMQSTGFFESCDSMRNVLFDLRLPLYAVIGYRSYLLPNSPDTAKRFLEPVVRAWEVDTVLLDMPDSTRVLAEHFKSCEAAAKPGFALLAEGKG